MIAAVPLRRAFLGAEELLELGQAAVRPAVAPAPSPPPVPAPLPSPSAAIARAVPLSPEEAKLVVQVTENIVEFAKSYPIEFHAYCPTDRWQPSLVQIGTWTNEIKRQLNAGSRSVSVPADALFHLIDLEKCVSAARDARLSSAKLAFTFSAVGAIADIVFGLSWIGIPAYIAGLAVLFGRPLLARVQAEPQEPFRPTISGALRGYWVEYVGPATAGRLRRAGPFGSPGQAMEYGLGDGGTLAPGRDGEAVVFDMRGQPVYFERAGGRA